jgi:hypothetical protein
LTYRHGRSGSHALTRHVTSLSLTSSVSPFVVIDDTILVQVNGVSSLNGVGSVSLGLGESLSENGLDVGVVVLTELLLGTGDGGTLVDCGLRNEMMKED